MVKFPGLESGIDYVDWCCQQVVKPKPDLVDKGDLCHPKLVVDFLTEAGTSKLTSTQLAWATSIIMGMNSTRTNYDYSIIPAAIIEPYWLVGFIEGEGTFGLKT